jgi:CRP-like cAMP-binding protein
MMPSGGRPLGDEEKAALAAAMETIVAQSHLFKSLDGEGRDRVLASGYVCSFRAGTPIIRQDEPGFTMYLVLNGTVRVQTQIPGSTVQLAELGRGACIGEVAVLTGAERTATVTAVTDVDCVAFAEHRIARVLDDYPKVREVLEKLVDARARQTIEKIVGPSGEGDGG